MGLHASMGTAVCRDWREHWIPLPVQRASSISSFLKACPACHWALVIGALTSAGHIPTWLSLRLPFHGLVCWGDARLFPFELWGVRRGGIGRIPLVRHPIPSLSKRWTWSSVDVFYHWATPPALSLFLEQDSWWVFQTGQDFSVSLPVSPQNWDYWHMPPRSGLGLVSEYLVFDCIDIKIRSHCDTPQQISFTIYYQK